MPELTAADKALIYHYSEDGYEALNENLRGGRPNSAAFGQGLTAALAKLPPYEGQVWSGVKLSTNELTFYAACALAGTPVRWPAFLSTSKKQSVAMQYLWAKSKNCLVCYSVAHWACY